MKKKSTKTNPLASTTSAIQNDSNQIEDFSKHANPWPGLAPYKDPSEYEDGRKYKFCGRAAETFDLLQLIENRSLVTLYGSTGIGKTSLLKAGVFPLLKQHIDERQQGNDKVRFHPIYVRLAAPRQLSDHDPQCFTDMSLSEILILCIENELRIQIDRKEEPESTNDIRYLWKYFHTRSFFNQEQRVTPVIVLDQFEELFSIKENDNKVKEFLKQLYILIENRISWRSTKGMHEARFRFVISLREDRFFYLEDFVDSLHLSLFKENRYRLRPMSDEQAIQVVTIPGSDIIESKYKEKIALNIINKARNKDRRDINTLMLSLICNQIYEREGILTIETSQSINMTLDSYYQNAIYGLPFSEVRFIEKHFVNGEFRQPVEEKLFRHEAPNAYKRFFKEDDSTFKIITDVVVPGKDTRHVELIHDQLAAVINARQKAKDKRWYSALLRLGILALIILAGLLLIFGGQETNKKEEQPLSLMQIKAGHFSTTDSLWIDQEHLKNNAMVEQLSIKNKTKFKIEKCPYLHTIDLSSLGRDTLNLSISNCDVLKTIVLPKSLHYLKLEISNCPKLNLNISKGLDILYISPMEDVLNIQLDSGVTRYTESGGVLWDNYDRRIVYYPRASASDIKGQTFSYSFPKDIKTDKLTYGTVTLTNLDYKEVSDGETRSSSTFYLNTKTQQQIDYWARSTQKGNEYANCYVLPDSLDYLPEGIFKSMIHLDSVVMPLKLKEIRPEAFEDCRKLLSIKLPEMLQYIGEKSFMGCHALKHIIIPPTVTSIGRQAFEGCTSLESVEILGDSVALADRAFANCPNLKSVKLPKSPIYYTKAEYNSPFYNCGNFNGKEKFTIGYNDAIERNEEYELAWNEKNELVIRLFENSSEIYLPIGYVQTTFNIEPDAHTLNHIHIPWPQPVYIKDGQKNELRFNLDKKDKQHITLHVPYGCKRYYEMNEIFTDFSNIVEDPLLLQTKNWIRDIVFLAKSSISKPISICFIIIFILLLVSTAIILQRKKWNLIGLKGPTSWSKTIVYAVLFCLLAFVFYTLLFWFFNLYCSFNVYCSLTCSAVLALLFSSLFFLASLFISWIERKKDEWIDFDKFREPCLKMLSKFKLSKKIIIILMCVIGTGAVGYYLYHKLHKNNTYSIALANGRYEKAISIYIDSLIETNHITQSEILQLRHLMAMNGDSAQLVLVAREHYDRCNPDYEGPWGVHDKISFIRNDSIFMFNTEKAVRWGGKDPFSRGIICWHEAKNQTVSYYDELSDSSIVYFPKDVTDTLRISGEFHEFMNEEKFILSKKKDGNWLLYDYYGRAIPYDKSINSRYLFNAPFFIGKTSNGQTFGFTHTATGPVSFALPQGYGLNLYNDRYLIWKVDGGKTFAFDISKPQNNPIPVDSGGCFETNEGEKVKYDKETYTIDRNRKDGNIIIFETKTNNSFILPSRFTNIAGTTWYNFVKDRFFWQGDNLYGEVAIFDLHDNGRLVAELEGTSCSFLQHPDNTFYVITDKGLQFYRIEDGNVFKTFCAKNNISRKYTMESYYHFCGNYLIHDENCNQETRQYERKVYSLTIPGAKHIPIVNEQVFACGDSLIVVNSQEKNFYFYSYETLEEQINRSKLIKERQKKNVLTLLKKGQK